MNLTHLRTFVAVVDAGSFSKASQVLGISQPAITMQIRGLEEELGLTLLDRKYRRLDLTEAGMTLLPYARRMLSVEGGARDELNALSGIVGGQLTIAASTTPGDYIIPPLLGDFVQLFPDVEINIQVASTSATVDALDACEADFGIVGAEVKGRKVDFEQCGHDELVPIVVAGHPLTGCKRLKMEVLADEPWVMRNSDSGTQAVANRLLEDNGLDSSKLRCMVELDTGEAIVAAVEGGLGVAIVSRYVADKSLKLGTVVELPITGRPWKRPFYLAFPHKTLPRAARAFVEFLRERLQ